MPKLTKRVIDAAEIQAAEYFIWDDELPGFALRVLPSGRKGYIVQYRAGRRSRRMSLGPSTVLTCEQARTRAIGIIAAARNGDDPAAHRDANSSYSVSPRCGSSALAGTLAAAIKRIKAAVLRIVAMTLTPGSQRPEIGQDIFLFLREEPVHRHGEVIVFQEIAQIVIIPARPTNDC